MLLFINKNSHSQCKEIQRRKTPIKLQAIFRYLFSGKSKIYQMIGVSANPKGSRLRQAIILANFSQKTECIKSKLDRDCTHGSANAYILNSFPR